MKSKKIETISDIRYRAWKEMLDFINWLAENHPKEWKEYCDEYMRKNNGKKS